MSWRRSVGRPIISSLARAGALGLIRRVKGRGQSNAEIVTYHRFSSRTTEKELTSFLEPVPAPRFEEHLTFLAREYEVISLGQLVARLLKGEPWPPRSLTITVDDGYRDFYEAALPVVERVGVPITVFVTAGCIDGGRTLWWDELHRAVLTTSRWPEPGMLRRDIHPDASRQIWPAHDPSSMTQRMAASRALVGILKMVPDEVRRRASADLQSVLDAPADGEADALMTWAQVKEAAAAGVEIGSHTLTHPSLDMISEHQIGPEIEGACHMIEARLGRRPTTFAYPGGSGWKRPSVREALRSAGITGAVTNVPRTNKWPGNALELGRRSIPNRDTAMLQATLLDLVPLRPASYFRS